MDPALVAVLEKGGMIALLLVAVYMLNKRNDRISADLDKSNDKRLGDLKESNEKRLVDLKEGNETRLTELKHSYDARMSDYAKHFEIIEERQKECESDRKKLRDDIIALEKKIVLESSEK